MVIQHKRSTKVGRNKIISQKRLCLVTKFGDPVKQVNPLRNNTRRVRVLQKYDGEMESHDSQCHEQGRCWELEVLERI